MTNFFPSRWPIVCAVMNGVSDLNLALAVHEAGAMPSLFASGEDRYEKLDCDLAEFTKCTGAANIVLHLGFHELELLQYIKLVAKYKVSHIELFGRAHLSDEYLSGDDAEQFTPMQASAIKLLKTTSKVSIRSFLPKKSTIVNAVALKGSDAAGLSGTMTTKDLFDQQILKTPNLSLIPYGGVGTPEQVKYYIDKGAAGVAVGTLFASSKESCLADTVKQKMISSKSSSLIKFNTLQQALILGSSDEVMSDNTENRQTSLEKGIAGQGGLIYAGKSIDYVNEIRSVSEIVDYLTELL